MRRYRDLTVGIPFVHKLHLRFEMIVLKQGHTLDWEHGAREARNKLSQFLAILVVNELPADVPMLFEIS
jgi:hypothetical protein